MVQASASTSTVASLSQATGLHENTVRDHLKALVDAGHVEQVTLPPPPRGRPAQGYVASPSNPEPDTRVRDYAGLAVTLARHLQRNSSDPAREAEVAGDGWGRELAVNRSGAEDAAQYVLSLMTDLGFEPRLGPDGGTIRLTKCPLLDAARELPDVVCGVHEGLINGALAEAELPADAHLHPFGEPNACLLTVQRRTIP